MRHILPVPLSSIKNQDYALHVQSNFMCSSRLVNKHNILREDRFEPKKKKTTKNRSNHNLLFHLGIFGDVGVDLKRDEKEPFYCKRSRI